MTKKDNRGHRGFGLKLKSLVETINIREKTDPKSFRVHGLDAESVEIDGRVEDVAHDISYFFTFIEGDEQIYMIMAWTLKKKKETYQNTFEKIAKTFRLLKNKNAKTESD